MGQGIRLASLVARPVIRCPIVKILSGKGKLIFPSQLRTTNLPNSMPQQSKGKSLPEVHRLPRLLDVSVTERNPLADPHVRRCGRGEREAAPLCD